MTELFLAGTAPGDMPLWALALILGFALGLIQWWTTRAERQHEKDWVDLILLVDTMNFYDFHAALLGPWIPRSQVLELCQRDFSMTVPPEQRLRNAVWRRRWFDDVLQIAQDYESERRE